MKKNPNPNWSNETDLIQCLLNSDSDAFQYIVQAYHPIMLSVARAIAGDSIADEIVQEAWISAIKALPKFEGRSTLKTWLIQIVSNGAKTRLRKERRQVSLDEGWQYDVSDNFDQRGHRLNSVEKWHVDTPEALLANEQLKQEIEHAYQSLPAMQRAVLTLIDIENYNLSEVCNILDITSSNARVLLHRARTALHHCIDKLQDH